MSTKQEARYFVVRYMYNDLRDEAANIGIVMASQSGSIKSRFLEDVTLKARADTKIDHPAIEDFRAWLDRTTDDIARRVPDAGQRMSALEESIAEHSGNVIRVNGPRSVLFDDFDFEVDTLFREWVAPQSLTREKVETGPRDHLGGLRREAKSAIMRVMRDAITTPTARKQLVSDYEIPGSVHRNKFDVALVPPSRASTVLLFHHVLVLPDAEESYDQAAALARRWMDALQKSDNHKSLTAVFYSRGDARASPPSEAAALLKQHHIQAASH